MIERCGDRQRKCDGLEKWPLRFFVESLPVMLQATLLLLACGLCRHMWSISAFVACTLIVLTGLGVVFYVAIVTAGTSSYACPFQTPVSTALHGPWKKDRHGILSPIVHSKRVLSRTHGMWNRGVRLLLCRQSPPTTIPLENIQVHRSESWLKPKDLAIIRRTNANDVRCVSWILRNITDPEALDAAIPLAGEIRWFDDGINVDPPYDLIVSTFEACFDSARTLCPGSRDRAYHSGRAMMWIHTLARCKSREFARTFPLPRVKYTIPVPDPDLEHLLRTNLVARNVGDCIEQLLRINPGHTPSHSQWVSNLLLHYSWANRTKLYYWRILEWVSGTHETKTTVPSNATLNWFLVWCTFFGSPVAEEVLKVQDKSYDISRVCSSNFSLLFTSDRMEPVLDQLAKAVLSTISDTRAQRGLIPHMLRDLINLETRPMCLTRIAYEWCSVIHENHHSLEDWESLLLVCLEIGFRHLDFQRRYIEAKITHTEHHRGLIDVVFKSQESEVIADLLHAWTTESGSHKSAYALLGFCAGHLVGLRNLVPFSSRLRRLVIRSVELIGYKGFEGAGVERFAELLNHLHVAVEDMDRKGNWAKLLLDIIRSSEGTQHLSHWYWELLVGLAVSESWLVSLDSAHSLRIVAFLTEAEEWSRLECWMGIIWMVLPREANAMAEGDLGHSMLLLFRQRPGAVQKLEQWIEQWGQENYEEVPESFKQICKRVREAAQQDTQRVPFYTHQTHSESHAGFCFVLGRFHPSTEALKSSPIYHRPSLPHRLEVINSGSRYRTVFSKI